MFGTNKQVGKMVSGMGHADGPQLMVKEIFKTLQGEGPFAGHPAVFIRLAGCNLACTFCDTDFEGGESIDVKAIAKKVRELDDHGRLVVITGGEPLLQDISLLIKELGISRIVQIETAGTVWQGSLDWFFNEPYYQDRIHITISPKTPEVNKQCAFRAKSWKYVVERGNMVFEDGLPLWCHQGKPRQGHPPARPKNGAPIYIQPMEAYKKEAIIYPADKPLKPGEPKHHMVPHKEFTDDNVQHAVEVCLKYGYRLSLQMHKMVGLP